MCNGGRLHSHRQGSYHAAWAWLLSITTARGGGRAVALAGELDGQGELLGHRDDDPAMIYDIGVGYISGYWTLAIGSHLP